MTLLHVQTKEYAIAEEASLIEAVRTLRGYRIAGMHEVMEFLAERLTDPNPHQCETWANAVLDSVTGLVTHDDRIYITQRASELIGLDSATPLDDGAIVLQGIPQEAVPLDLSALRAAGVNRLLHKDEVYRADGYCHPGWLAFAEGDVALVQMLADASFDAAHAFHGRDTCMGFYVPPASGEPRMHAAFFSYLGWEPKPADYSHERYGLATSNARLLGEVTITKPYRLGGQEARFE